MSTVLWGKGKRPHGVTPSVALVNPKYANNVGMVLRLAACYGLKQVWFTGNRFQEEVEVRKRLPREERMKGYADVDLIQYDYFFDQFPRDVTPVAIEVRENSEPLFSFEHPKNPLYIFGPEDGSIPQVLLKHCHRFVVIPSRHCFNLATAVAQVLYDRDYKRFMQGEITEPSTPGEFEARGLELDFIDQGTWAP